MWHYGVGHRILRTWLCAKVKNFGLMWWLSLISSDGELVVAWRSRIDIVWRCYFWSMLSCSHKSEQRAMDNDWSEGQHLPCYLKAPSRPVLSRGFQGDGNVLRRSSPNTIDIAWNTFYDNMTNMVWSTLYSDSTVDRTQSAPLTIIWSKWPKRIPMPNVSFVNTSIFNVWCIHRQRCLQCMMNPSWTNAYEAYNTSSVAENISIFYASVSLRRVICPSWIKAFEV